VTRAHREPDPPDDDGSYLRELVRYEDDDDEQQPQPISCGVSLHVVLSDDYTCITMPGHTYYKRSLEAAPACTIQLA